jgi:DNA-binding NarL/FixJ family response regulator
MARKRVILAHGSRLLREVLQRVIDKADNLEVVQEIPNHEELPAAIERLGPEWVILSLPSRNNGHDWMDACMAEHPSLRFILLSPDNNSIKMRWQVSYEEDLTNLSLKDFIHILEKDLQHI